ncbi:MAG: hypothetical protein ACTSU5_07910 [Promethearchaeota archaeon]
MISLKNLDLAATLKSPEVRESLSHAGRYRFCERYTIPCYFEAMYYSEVTKYLPVCLSSRLGYLKKEFVLEVKLGKKWRIVNMW